MNEVETREICCQGCQKPLGTMERPKGTLPEHWAAYLSGYFCESCIDQQQGEQQQ